MASGEEADTITTALSFICTEDNEEDSYLQSLEPFDFELTYIFPYDEKTECQTTSEIGPEILLPQRTDLLPKCKTTKKRNKRKASKKRDSVPSKASTSLNSHFPIISSPGILHSRSVSQCRLGKLNPRTVELSPASQRVSSQLPLAVLPHERRKKLPLLAAIKPQNEKVEKERFMRAGFNYNPQFVYRNPAEEGVMDRFKDPSDQYLYIAVDIMYRSINKFGSYENFEEATGGRILSRTQIVNTVKKYLKKEDLESEVQLNLSEDMLSRGSLTQKKGQAQLNVRVVNLRENWCEGLLRHELGTHYLRSMNNRNHPWRNWRRRLELDMKHFNPSEEGLACLNSVLFQPEPFLWRAAVLYYVTLRAVHFSFKELFMDLGRFVRSPCVRWDYCVRAKRGQADTSRSGTFCKDQVYLIGALQLLKRRKHLDFQQLMQLGKVAHGDMDRLADLAQLEGTRIPSFMKNLDQYRSHLDRIASCNGLTDALLETVE